MDPVIFISPEMDVGLPTPPSILVTAIVIPVLGSVSLLLML
jgi:hypothetical protein